jgi:hypothetical protein
MLYGLLQEAKSSDKLTVDVSPDVVKSIAQADLGRRNASNGKGKDSKDVEKQLSDQMVSCCVKQVFQLTSRSKSYQKSVELTLCLLWQTRIVDRAKQLASQDTEQGTYKWGEFLSATHCRMMLVWHHRHTH